MTGYPHTEQFLRHAAASCGMPATHKEEHGSIDTGTILTLVAPSQSPANPENKLRIIRVRVDALRLGELATRREPAEKPFEGTVVKSSHSDIKRGDDVIGLATKTGETLLVNASNEADMDYLQTTFSKAEYRNQLVL